MLQMNKEPTAEALTAAAEHNATGMFLVFAFNAYYPDGGFNDFIGMALSLDQAPGYGGGERRGAWWIPDRELQKHGSC